MIQRHEILLNRFYTATTETITSDLTLVNNYYLNTSEGQSENITDASNIRGFLSNGSNQTVVQLFVGFLTGSTLMNSSLNKNIFTPTPDFNEVFQNDDKLSDIFNQFYINTILRGIKSTDDTITNNLLLPDNDNVIKTATTYQTNFFFWSGATIYPKGMDNIPLDITNGVRTNEVKNATTYISTDENYYIPVFIKTSANQLSRMIFDVCDEVINKNISGSILTAYSQTQSFESMSSDAVDIADSTDAGTTPTISATTATTLIQCFVDLNLNVNENSFWE